MRDRRPCDAPRECHGNRASRHGRDEISALHLSFLLADRGAQRASPGWRSRCGEQVSSGGGGGSGRLERFPGWGVVRSGRETGGSGASRFNVPSLGSERVRGGGEGESGVSEAERGLGVLCAWGEESHGSKRERNVFLLGVGVMRMRPGGGGGVEESVGVGWCRARIRREGVVSGEGSRLVTRLSVMEQAGG